MKILITFNFVIGILFTAITIASAKWESLFLLGIFPFLGFGVLALFNIASIFILWKRHRLRAFIPLATLAISVAASFLVAGFGTDLVLRNTPSQPDSFFNNQTKTELTDTAKHLVGNGFKEIILQSDKPMVHMIAGRREKEVDPKILTVMTKYGFVRADIDDTQKIVMFGYPHLRTWFDYIWTQNGLSEPDLMPSTITEVDIEDWTELIRIAKQNDPATQKSLASISFYPSVVYPYLSDALGPEMLNQFKDSNSTNRLSDENKNVVLTALNKQRLVLSVLVENPQITYEPTNGLYICGCSINNGFWVTRLLGQLLSQGVLKYAPDGHHLKIKTNLTSEQRLQVEWLHVGIMNFVYGNLLEKRQYPFQKKLGDNWYFNRW
jgi:hypothetical protein